MKKAAELYRQAADLGEPVAAANLAQCYAGGQGVPRSFKKALWWADLAVRRGAMYFQTDRDEIARLAEKYKHLPRILMAEGNFCAAANSSHRTASAKSFFTPTPSI